METLFKHLKHCGNTPFLSCAGRTFTYATFCEKVETLKSYLEKEIPEGEAVALLADYGMNGLSAFFALALNRNILVPISTKIQADIDLREEIAQCSFSVSFLEGASTPQIKKLEPLPIERELPIYRHLKRKKAPGLVLFSSGSTGTPKAMLHNLKTFAETFRPIKKSTQRKYLIFLLFDHIGGINTFFKALSVGATLVIPGERAPGEIADLIERERVDVLPTTPTFLNLLLIEYAQKQRDFSSLKLITYGTEPMPETLLTRLKKAFPRVRTLQTFGTSETGISRTKSFSSSSTLMKIDDPTTEYKIVKGELWLKTKTQILGYLNEPADTRFSHDGWFRTGDLVEERESGFLKIIGRQSDIINVGGEKVFPAEVEGVLLKLPQILDVTVFGEKNLITGQTVSAKVVLRQKMKPLEVKKLIFDFCRPLLARYKIPTKIYILSETEVSERFKKKRTFALSRGE